MKKIIFVIFFITAGGFAFFFGWAQFFLPAGSVGVMRSKTHGFDEKLIEEGKFRWVWYKLIPKNVVITAYKLENRKLDFTMTGKLLSGESYAAFAGLNESFDYSFSFLLSYSLKNESLVGVVKKNALENQEELDEWEESLAGRIRLFVQKQLETGDLAGSLLDSSGNGRLEKDILSRFPMIGNLSIQFTAAEYPNIELYRSVKKLYGDHIREQEEFLKAALGKDLESALDSRKKFDELARYGELLTKYPVLLDYLKLEKDSALE